MPITWDPSTVIAHRVDDFVIRFGGVNRNAQVFTRPHMLDGVADIFGKNHKTQKQAEAKTDELYRQIGQLKVENDFLARKLSS